MIESDNRSDTVRQNNCANAQKDQIPSDTMLTGNMQSANGNKEQLQHPNHIKITTTGSKVRNLVNFIIIVIVATYIISLLSMVNFFGGWRNLNYPLVISLLVLNILAIVLCNSVAILAKNRDSMTLIGNADWITHKGGFLHYRKKLKNYACIFVNMKGSKYMNEKYGNAFGDEVIIKFAQSLRKFLKGHGYVGRMGGDNFLVFAEKDYLPQLLEYFKRNRLTIESGVEPKEYHVFVRCGVVYVDERMEYRDIINHASTALFNAKSSKQDFVVYEEVMREQYVEENQIILDCKAGLERDEFIPYYQPKIDAKTERLCGAEALVRWNHDGKVLSPYVFVPALEKAGKIADLDMCIFEHMCKDIKDWERRGIQPVRISSNFSKLHLKDEKFADKIIAIMNRYEVDSKYIEVELTESSGCEDFELLKAFSEKIKKVGIRLAIDDFGTGYSSLSMLREFDADVVKLDKSFLDSASNGGENSKRFIHDIIHMIDNQEEETLCEGVETRDQLSFLQDAGCSIIQGFFYDKPLPHAEFEERLKQPQYAR